MVHRNKVNSLLPLCSSKCLTCSERIQPTERSFDFRETHVNELRVHALFVFESTSPFLNPQWKTLTKEEQATYFRAAEKERLLHALQHPGWSFKHNYVRTQCRATAASFHLRAEGGWLSADVTLCVPQGKRKFRNRKNRKATADVKSEAFLFSTVKLLNL